MIDLVVNFLEVSKTWHNDTFQYWERFFWPKIYFLHFWIFPADYEMFTCMFIKYTSRILFQCFISPLFEIYPLLQIRRLPGKWSTAGLEPLQPIGLYSGLVGLILRHFLIHATCKRKQCFPKVSFHLCRNSLSDNSESYFKLIFLPWSPIINKRNYITTNNLMGRPL